MKKQFLLLGLAVAAMTSCTNDEVLDQVQPVQKAIGFEAFTNKATRAVTETTNANLANFYVFGYYDNTNVFDNVEIAKTAVKDENGAEQKDADGNAIYAWEYTGDKKYWTQNTYHFGAYANGHINEEENSNKLTTSTNVSFADGKLTFTDYTVTDERDLIADVASVNNASLTASTVGFTFKHMLSKIQFVVRNTSEEYTMRIVDVIIDEDTQAEQTEKIDGLVINGVKTQGTCVLEENATTTWTPKESSATRESFVPFAATSDVTTTEAGLFGKYATTDPNKSYKKISDEYFVMPQNVSNIAFTIRAEFLDDNNQVVKQKEVTGNLGGNSVITAWEAGTFYTYHISLPTAAVPIEFTVTDVSGFTSHNNGTPIELNYDDEDTPTE